MDGKQASRLVLDFLDEEVASQLFAKPRVIYDYLDMAAVSFSRETGSLTSSFDITTIADQQTYDLPPDFVAFFMKTPRGRYFAKYYDGSNYSWPLKSTYEKIFKTNLTTAKLRPSRFCLLEQGPSEWAREWTRVSSRLTTEAGEDLLTEAGDYIVLEGMDRGLVRGAATAISLQDAGECTLEDTKKAFTTTHRVYPRDIVHNITDKSSGIVLGGVDSTHLVTALFDGAKNGWTLGDQYVIVPNAHSRIMLEAASENAGHILTVPYVCMPAPVFSDYSSWRLPPRTCTALIHEAAFMYQNQKNDFSAANRHHQIFADELLRYRREKAQERLQAGRYRERT